MEDELEDKSGKISEDESDDEAIGSNNEGQRLKETISRIKKFCHCQRGQCQTIKQG